VPQKEKKRNKCLKKTLFVRSKHAKSYSKATLTRWLAQKTIKTHLAQQETSRTRHKIIERKLF